MTWLAHGPPAEWTIVSGKCDVTGKPAVAETAIIHRYSDACNAFDLTGMRALLSPDVLFENHAGEALTASAHGTADFR